MGHISTVEVRYAETDQMGIAHHSNYAIWFEVARTDFIKAAGISYTDVEKEGIITPLTSLECKYKKQLSMKTSYRFMQVLQSCLRFVWNSLIRLQEMGTDRYWKNNAWYGDKRFKTDQRKKRTSGNLPNVRKCFGLKIT